MHIRNDVNLALDARMRCTNFLFYGFYDDAIYISTHLY